MGDVTGINWIWLYDALEWAIRLGALVYVPQRRTPAAARTWLLLIFLSPYAGLALYGIFGRIQLPKRRREMLAELSVRLRAAAQDVPANLRESLAPLPGAVAEAAQLVEKLTAFPMLGGNSVELLSEYQPSLDRLAEDIHGARRSVHLLTYIYGDDSVAERVTRALEAAAKRGVSCRLLLDGMGCKAGLKTVGPRLRTVGVEVVELLPVKFLRRDKTRMDLRNHRKIAVIDGNIGYIGSQNIVAPHFVPGHPNEELVARVTGPVVVELDALFRSDRFAEIPHPISETDLRPDLTPTGPVFAQLVPSSPGYRQHTFSTLLVWLVHQARERVHITTPYFVPDESFLGALRTAVERGVDVRLVLSKHSNQAFTIFAQRSFYEELLDAGVKVYLYRPHFLHAKSIAIDGELALVGSSNMDIRSFALNAEANLLIHDARVAARLREINERHFADSDQLTAEDWARRPLLARVAQNVARLADSLL